MEKDDIGFEIPEELREVLQAAPSYIIGRNKVD
jgi:hypothetical protein